MRRSGRGKHYDDRGNKENVVHMYTPFRLCLDDYDYLKMKPAAAISHCILRAAATVLLWPYFIIMNGFRVRGRKNLYEALSHGSHGGCVTVANHIDLMDAPMVGCAVGFRRIYFVTEASNLCIPVIRHFVAGFDGVPLSNDAGQAARLYDAMKKALYNGKIVHVYPEGVLVPYCDHLRPFYRGAFKLAADAGVPVVPMIFTYRKAHGLSGHIRKRPYITCSFLPAVYPDMKLPARDRSVKIMEQSFSEMQDACERVRFRHRV